MALSAARSLRTPPCLLSREAPDVSFPNAGLDVYDREPAVHPGYLKLENVVLLPHLGSATAETRNAMGFLALDGIDAVLAGRIPPNLVN